VANNTYRSFPFNTLFIIMQLPVKQRAFRLHSDVSCSNLAYRLSASDVCCEINPIVSGIQLDTNLKSIQWL
jgi:hypothetical protein